MLCQQPFLPNPRPAGRVVAGAVYRAHLRLRLRCTRLLEIGVLAGRHLCAKAIGEETLLKNQSDGHLRLGCFPRFPCFPSIAVENTESGEVPGYWKLASLPDASFVLKQSERGCRRNRPTDILAPGCFPRFPCFPPRGMENRKAVRYPATGNWRPCPPPLR